MFFRRAWQRVGPLARRVFRPVSRDAVPVRHMAFGGFPGGSTNMTYFVLCGGGLTAAVVYAYKTVNGDTERYEERLASMGSTETAKAAPEAAAPAAEPVAKELEAPAVEAAIESVSAPAEPVAETSAEPVVEASPEEESAGAATELIVTEAAAEPAVTDDAAPPAALEELPEAAVEVAATVETLAEAPAAESAGTAAVDEVPPCPPAEAKAEAEVTPAAEAAA